MAPPRPLGRALTTAAVGVGAALLWAAAVERRWYVLRHATVPVLPPDASRPLRLMHVSDLHQLPGQSHRLDFVRACARTAPDVIVLTGDLLESGEAIDEVVATLGEVLDGRPGLAVLGSHDRWGSTLKNPMEYLYAPHRRACGVRLDTDRLVDGLQAAGYEVVDNRRATVKTPAGLVDVAGLGDAHLGLDHPEWLDWSAPAEDVVLRLGLAHAPYRRVLDVFGRHGFPLVLAGHTHGGQVRVPVLGALTNNSDLPLRHSRGLSRLADDRWLHVSAGLGHSRFAPLRFACRPEATLLDLVPRRP